MSPREKHRVDSYMCWKCFDEELSENHLGVALIQPGDSVIVTNERFYDCNMEGAIAESVAMCANME